MKDNLVKITSNRSDSNCGYLAEKSKAVFFDRDGVLNVDKEYLHSIEELEWVDGAKESVAYLTNNGYTVFVVTNQSGIARGYYEVEDMQRLHEHMAAEIAEAGGKVTKFIIARICQPARSLNMPLSAIAANRSRGFCCRQ